MEENRWSSTIVLWPDSMSQPPRLPLPPRTPTTTWSNRFGSANFWCLLDIWQLNEREIKYRLGERKRVQEKRSPGERERRGERRGRKDSLSGRGLETSLLGKGACVEVTLLCGQLRPGVSLLKSE